MIKYLFYLQSSFQNIFKQYSLSILIRNNPCAFYTHFSKCFLEIVSLPVVYKMAKRIFLGSICVYFSTKVRVVVKIFGKIIVSKRSYLNFKYNTFGRSF